MITATNTRKRPHRAPSKLIGKMGIFAGASGKILPMSWGTLGEAVRHRRKELGLTQADVTARGGPSVETLRAIENNRAGRLGRQSRRALEQAIQWDFGSIDVVLEGGTPQLIATSAAETGPPPATFAKDSRTASTSAWERFAMAERLIKVRQVFGKHREAIPADARTAIESEFTAAAREFEDALIGKLQHLGDDERAAAIRILAELRDG